MCNVAEIPPGRPCGAVHIFPVQRNRRHCDPWCCRCSSCKDMLCLWGQSPWWFIYVNAKGGPTLAHPVSAHSMSEQSELITYLQHHPCSLYPNRGPSHFLAKSEHLWLAFSVCFINLPLLPLVGSMISFKMSLLTPRSLSLCITVIWNGDNISSVSIIVTIVTIVLWLNFHKFHHEIIT